MKRIVIYLALILTWVSYAQIFPVQVTPQLIPPYSLKLSDYQTTTSEKLFVNLLLTDAQETGRQVRLKMFIEGQGLAIQTLDVVAGAAPIFLDGGLNLRLSNIDLRPYFSLNNLQGITPQQYNQPLPDGRYRFCFEVTDVFSGRPISTKSCFSAFLISNDPPFLNVPNRGDLVTAQTPQNIIFNWTPRHLNATGVQYEFVLKELWDTGLDPQAAFLNSPVLHQETTLATTLLYGPANIQLLEGKTYGWQVRALVSDGISETSVFKNNGFSEIYHFKYEGNCDVPRFVLSEALNAENVAITWDFSNHLRYEIQYRKKGYGDDDWFSLYAYNQQSKIYNLEAGETYEFRVGGECTPQGGFAFSQIYEFTTPTQETAASYNCGILPEIEITNQNPLQNIGINEVFVAGDFPVTVKQIKSSGQGIYSGWGFITVPYLADTKLRVEFENIHINTDFQLIEGTVETSYDKNWGDIASVDELIDDVFGSKGDVKTFDATNIDVTAVKVDENGKIILIDAASNPHPIEVDTPVVITDKDGEKWKVDEDGKVTNLGKEAEGGTATKENTNGVGSNGTINTITSQDVTIVFNPSGFYSTDQLRTAITTPNYVKEYPSIPLSRGGDYNVMYKAVSNSPNKTDVIEATATLKNGKTTSDIIFKTKEGVTVPTTWEDNTATLTIEQQFNFVKDEIIATVRPKDSTANYDIAGKMNIWHLQQQEVNLTIVPIANATLDDERIKEQINAIYNPVGVNFNITVAPSFSINKAVWDVENVNDKLDVGDSNILANYTPEERAIYKHYKTQHPIQNQMYYVFVLGDAIKITNTDVEGFMPLKRQYGFVFNASNTARTIAHELGHGIFGLEHPFTEYNSSQGSTDLLMDYGLGTAFTHMDWQKIHAPGLQLYLFQGDEDGENHTIRGLFKRLNFGKNEDETFSFLTPTAQYTVLPKDVKDVVTFYGYYGTSFKEDKETFKEFMTIVPGTLKSFKIGEKIFDAVIDLTGNTLVLKGYFNKEEKYEPEKYGIVLGAKNTKNAIIFAVEDNNNTIGYKGIEIKASNYSVFTTNSVIKSPLDYPYNKIWVTSVKDLKVQATGSQYSYNPQEVEWVFKSGNYTPNDNTLLIRNKILEFKTAYSKYIENTTERYGKWETSNACNAGYGFDNFLKNKFCNYTPPAGFGNHIGTFSRNELAFPEKALELQKMYYEFLIKDADKQLNDVSVNLLSYNDLTKIEESNCRIITKTINTGNQNDISLLKSETILFLIKKLIQEGCTTEGYNIENTYEYAIVKLINESNKKNADELIKGLTDNKYHIEEKALLGYLFDVMHDWGGEDNFTLFTKALIKQWKASSFNNIEDVEILPYESDKTLGFYFDNYDFSFADKTFRTINVYDPLKNKVTHPYVYQTGTGELLHTFNAFTPVYLTKFNTLNAAFKPSVALVPLFVLKALEVKNKTHNWETGGVLVFDVLTTFSGFGNLAKLRHFIKLKKLSQLDKLRNIKIIFGASEFVSGSAGIMLNLIDCKPENASICDQIRAYLFFIEMASLSGDAIVSRKIKNAIKETASDALEAIEKSGTRVDPKILDELRAAKNGGETLNKIKRLENAFEATSVTKKQFVESVYGWGNITGDKLTKLKEDAYLHWAEGNYDDLYDLFNKNLKNENKINGGWPPYNGFKQSPTVISGKDIENYNVVYDRFQTVRVDKEGNIIESQKLGGGFASPVPKNKYDVDYPYSYASRALMDDISEGTYYIKFKLKNTQGVSFEVGEAIPWRTKEGKRVQGKATQIKSNVKLNELEKDIDYEILQRSVYRNSNWVDEVEDIGFQLDKFKFKCK